MELKYTKYPGEVESASISVSDTQQIKLMMNIDEDGESPEKSLCLSVVTNEFGTDSEVTAVISFENAKDLYIMIHKFLQQMK